MTGLALVRGLVLSIFALGLAGPAAAQDNRELGKSPAQLFASDCAICHKSPQGLSKAGGIFGLQGFLREHYTTSRETAGAIAAYLSAVDRAAPPPQQQRRATTTRAPKTDQKTGAGAAKPVDKLGEEKPERSQTPDPKASVTEAKPSESKPAEAQPAEAKPEAKPAESKGAAEPAASDKPQ